MRIAVQVIVGVLLVIVCSALWTYSRLDVGPDVVALVVTYMGFLAKKHVSPAVLGAVALGYITDLTLGSTPGLIAASAGILCLLAHMVSDRVLIRGWPMTAACSFVASLLMGIFTLMFSKLVGIDNAGFFASVKTLFATALVTALTGPLIFACCRAADRRLLRTQRDKHSVREGLVP